jgi:hypothetical protein
MGTNVTFMGTSWVLRAYFMCTSRVLHVYFVGTTWVLKITTPLPAKAFSF